MVKKLDCDEEHPKDFDGAKDIDLFDMLNFPLEDVEVDIGKDDWNNIPLPDLPLDYCLSFPVGVGVFPNDTSKPNKILPTSYEKSCRLKQLPTASSADETESTIKSSNAGSKLLSHDSTDVKSVRLFNSSSPVSTLESTNAYFTENQRHVDKKFIAPKRRARSKRQRFSNLDRLRSLSFFPPTCSSFASVYPESDSGTVDDGKMFKPCVKKPVRKGGGETRNNKLKEPNTTTTTTKRCTHCQVTSTPQWREGPSGPKTLCNACGVRYRSGRLFPEYRPAASPTFIPSVHSNSHKKVIEMRNKGGGTSVEHNYGSQPGNSVRHVFD